MSLGIRSGVNCTRENVRSSASRHRLHEQRLREAGHADEERVAAAEERGDEVVDDLVLADDPSPDLRDELLVRAREIVQEREVFICGSRDGHYACGLVAGRNPQRN